MSDPVSNAEIEDVLSSIRRLVSIDERDKDDAPKTVETPTAKKVHDTTDDPVVSEEALPKEDERLVLTSYFRVNPEDDEHGDQASEDAPDESGDRLTLGKWQVSEDAGTEDLADEAPEEASGAGADHDWRDDDGDDFEDAGYDDLADESDMEDEPDVLSDEPEATRSSAKTSGDDTHLKEWLTSDDQKEEAWSFRHDDESEAAAVEDAATLEDYETAVFVEDSDLEFEFDEASATDADEDARKSEPAPSELEARIAEVEAAVAARQDQWEPDGDSEDAYSGGQTEPLPWEDHEEAAPPVFFSRAAQDAAIEVSQNDKQDPSEASGASDEIQEAGAPTERDKKRRDTSVDAIQDDSMDRDRTAQATDRFTANLTPDSSEREGSWYREDADAVLDEDALRDLVSEIVRQELQGSLGERITRNVRKLVRREIHRAMMGQDLD